MLSSQKSDLMKYLETFAVSETPEVVPENNIDAIFSLRPHVNLPNTFEAVARSIINSEGDTIHFVCDKWIEPSIKDCK